MQFCHLRVHSSFTFGEGASTIEELIARAQELEMPALALTDKDGLYGAVQFYQQARNAGIKPLLGTEVTTSSDHPLVLLAKNEQGYGNLCQLITRMHLSSSDEPRLTLDALQECSHGILVLSGGPRAELCQLLAAGERAQAERAIRRYTEILGPDNFVIELQNHLLPHEESINQALFELACRLHVLICATNDVYYATPQQHDVHQLLTTSARVVHHRSVEERPNREYYLKSHPQMARLFLPYPFTLVNTALVAQECTVRLPLGETHAPECVSLNPARAHAHLTTQCFQHLSRYYPSPPREVVQRLIHELNLIREKQFSSYFLLVADIVAFARDQGIRCTIRGSAPGSLVAYLLGISSINPLTHNLLFERFLNPDRQDFPDIDLDFDSRKRDRVIQYVFEKYGKDNVGLVATISTFRARGALREAGRALGLSYTDINRATEYIPYLPANRLREALHTLPELRDSELSRQHQLVDFSERLHGLTRHLSVHLGGVVIAPEEFTSLVPLQKSLKGYPVCQYDKDDLEQLGFIKLDLLSLRMLGALEEAREFLARQGTILEYDQLSFDDEAVYRLLRSTQTMGCFQLESPGMRQLLGKLQPRSFSDIVITISLFRPGPMQANMMTPFLARRHGTENVQYLHPRLKAVLHDTHGVIIFQEQVLRIAQELAGFTLGQADLLRRAMKRKISDEEKHDLEQAFLRGCRERGVTRSVAHTIFSQIAAFGAFGFCRAHATAFARTSYHSAYLKHYHPHAFYLGVLNNEPGLYPPGVILHEAQRAGITVAGPDIHHSDSRFRLEHATLRVGLLYVHGMGPRQMDAILQARAEAPFASFSEFCERVRLAPRLLEHLALLGCFDELPGFQEEIEIVTSPPYRDKPLSERISLEQTLLGFSFSGHPLHLFRDRLDGTGRITSAELLSCSEHQPVTVAGIKILVHTPPTKSGTRVMFLTLEDEEGLIDVTVFPRVQTRGARIIREAGCLLVQGYVQRHGPAASVVARDVQGLGTRQP